MSLFYAKYKLFSQKLLWTASSDPPPLCLPSVYLDAWGLGIPAGPWGTSAIPRAPEVASGPLAPFLQTILSTVEFQTMLSTSWT